MSLPEPPPLGGVLGVLVLPEPVVPLGAVDDQLRAHGPADVGLLLVRDHADRRRAAVQGVLRGEAAEPTAGAPDEDVVALLHARAVVADQLPVRRGVHQAGGGGLLPGEVGGLGHQLVGLDQGQLREPAEVGLEPPDPLLGVEHRVVVAVGALELDAQAVRDDLVAGLPPVHARAGAQHHAGEVGADDVVGQVVPLGERAEAAVALEEAEGRHRLEDARPDGVVVDGAGHHRDERLARTQLGDRHLVDVQRLARVLVLAVQARRTCRPRPCGRSPPGRTRALEGGVLLARGVPGEDGVADLLHGLQVSAARRSVGRSVRHLTLRALPLSRREGRRVASRCPGERRRSAVRSHRVSWTVAARPPQPADAGSTSSTSTPPASLGWTKLTREPEVPRRGSSYSSRRPRARRTSATASTSLDPVGDLLDAGAGAVEELRDRGVGGERREQLDARAGVADRDHRLADALLLVGLLVHDLHAEGVAVERDRLVEVGHGDADVVDGREQVAGEASGRLMRSSCCGQPRRSHAL